MDNHRMWTCKESVFFLICFLCGMLYFGYQDTEEMDQRAKLGLVFSAEDVTPAGMTLVCKQTQENWYDSIELEPQFELRRKSKIGWIKVPFLQGKEQPIYISGWVDLPVGQTKTISEIWDDLYGDLDPGVYQLEKSVVYSEDGLYPFERLEYYIEFTVK